MEGSARLMRRYSPFGGSFRVRPPFIRHKPSQRRGCKQGKQQPTHTATHLYLSSSTLAACLAAMHEGPRYMISPRSCFRACTTTYHLPSAKATHWSVVHITVN